MRLWNLAALAALLALAGCQAFDRPAPEAARAGAGALEDDMFLGAALAHVQSQRDLARMTVAKAQSPALLTYAKSVASEREGLAQRLADAAERQGVGADGNAVPHAQDFAHLTGLAFERAYVAAQIEDQRNTLDDFRFEAANGRDGGLKSLAAAELPRLEQDLAGVEAAVKTLPLGQASDTDTLATPGL
ncbi:MAG: DUF4142 domain-containing protein [Stellaceae bacterium]